MIILEVGEILAIIRNKNKEDNMTQLLSSMIEGAWNADFGGTQFYFWLMLATFIFSKNLEKRKHWGLRAGLIIAVVFALTFLIPPYQMPSPYGMICWFLTVYFINALVVYSYCDVSVLEAFSCASYASLTEHIASSAYVLFLTTGYQSNVAYTAISLSVYMTVWFLVGRKMGSGGHYRALWIRKLTTSAMTVMVVTVLSCLCKIQAGLFVLPDFESETARLLLRYSQVYSIAFCLAMLAMEYHSEMQLRAQNQVAVSHELLMQKEKEFRLTQENIDLINRKCHDMKHQVSLLMEQDGERAELREKFGREIIKTIEIYDSNIQTGNEILNTLLMDKSLYCSMHGIVWTCMAQGEMLDFIEPMDLASLMGNALENAVEAVERLDSTKQRIIGVQIGKKDHFVQIRIENSYDGKLVVHNNRIVTRKCDHEYHGFGIASIRSIAEKYGGYASTITEGDTFVLSVLIPIPKESNTP